jgi:hypothetical protein
VAGGRVRERVFRQPRPPNVGYHQCSPIATFEKDAYSPHYFLPGAFYFPSGPGLRTGSFVHTVAFRDADNATFCLQRES